jgi:hypothetical protein
MQEKLMLFDPATCGHKPYPSHAGQWRDYWGSLAWLYNPWTGDQRKAGDVGSDPFGHLIRPPNTLLMSAPIRKDTMIQESHG